ncbi:MAG: M1 family metallopeptidase [Bacteroidota bacterium]
MYRYLFIKLILLLVINSNEANAQYFQQDVSYQITASQDTSNHTITAMCDITYTNNSSNELDTFFLHLWANAFSDKLSAFNHQAIRMGQLEFYFAKEKEMGGYNNLEVTFQGRNVTLYSWKGNTDVVYFLLPKKLQPSETVEIKTKYNLKLPQKVSRMGYTRYDDFLMYWYPSPAVYDAKGWHPMPYLNMGETYMEVADFEVDFNSPLESVIASVLPDENSKGSQRFYKAHDVIDFAIATSTNKNVRLHPLRSKKGKEIDLQIMTRYLKRDSSTVVYLQKALEYFEPLIGDFPYSSLAVMDKGKKSTSGMEYPGLITVSGMDDASEDFEYYLVHELLHQWFYSALAFNQRDFAWLDEGLTTYYQQRYYKEIKGVDHYSTKGKFVMHEGQQPILHTVARAQACRHYHLPLNTDVSKVNPINYGFNAYEIPARMFAYLADYVGHRKFDTAIQAFYSKWKDNHPGPQDLKKAMEEVSNKNLNWFFDDLINRDWSYDYEVKRIDNGKLEVEHKHGSTPPYKITFSSKDGQTKEVWVEGHEGIELIPLPGEEYIRAIIDENGLSMDINTNNNSINVKRPIKLVPGIKLDDGRYRELYFLPTVSYNTSDGGMLGLALYNSSFPSKKLKWALSPAYGVNSSKPVGEAWISYDHYLKSEKIRKLQYKINAKSYSFRNSETLESALRYTRFSPHVSLHFKHQLNEQLYSKVYLKTIFLNEEKFVFNDEDFSIGNDQSSILRLGYERYNFWNLGPSEFITNLEYQPYTNSIGERHHYLKLNAEYYKSFAYSPGRSVDFRFWASYFISNSQRESSNYDGTFARGASALIYQGFNDYAYDGYFFNRANQGASLDNQIGYQGGGFKTPFGSQYSIGQTNDFAIALNLKSNLPIKAPRFFPLKLFLDVGYFRSKETVESELEGTSIYSGGVMLEYGEGAFCVYLPLINSQAISDIYEIEGIGTLGRVSFKIDLIRFNPWDIAEDFSF